MANEQIIELIDRYLAGKCSPEEARTVEQWYESYLRTGSDFYRGDTGAINRSADRSLSAIRARLGLAGDSNAAGSSDPASDSNTTNGRRKIRTSYRWLAAASVLLALTIGFLLRPHKTAPETFTIVNANTGEIKQIKLPDGTNVWLNAGSILKYSSSYNKNDRSIYLTGEAYFDVTDNVNKPFTIYSGRIETQVLGTAFSISAYPNTLVNTVTVVQGKVQVKGGGNVLGTLLANQELQYDLSSGNTSLININAGKITSWKSGKLAFIEMPMQDIAIHLQKWYGVKFIFKNEMLKNRKFTASFDNNIDLNDLLSIMYEVTHADYHVDQHTGTVTFL